MEPEEETLLRKVRDSGTEGYKIQKEEILVASSLYHRNLIVEHHDKSKTWTYVLGRGWF